MFGSHSQKPQSNHTSRPSEAAPSDSGFGRFRLGVPLQKGIAAAGFSEPRPIQEKTIPAALEGRDVLGLAQTGTGKTAAFALPILERLSASRRPGPRALVIAPTRELANQIDAEIRLLARFTPVKTTTVFGGVSMGRQISDLRRRPDIVVACPGRLLDLMNQRAVRLDAVETLVLDEADHMFDMGFLPDIRRILAALPKERQNLLFSATMPREIRRLADEVLGDPHVVELAHSMPAETIAHALYPVAEKRKLDLLKRLISEENFSSAIVFTRTKHRARRMAEQLSKSGHRAVALQGNMSQAQRDRAMNGFRKKQFDILVATDIAARGIDVAGVSHVVNFDVPNTPDAYTHRIGRTGRAERQGKACTFVTDADRASVRAIERKIGTQIPRVRVAGFEERSGGLDEASSRDGRDPRGDHRNRGGRQSRDSRASDRREPQRGEGREHFRREEPRRDQRDPRSASGDRHRDRQHAGQPRQEQGGRPSGNRPGNRRRRSRRGSFARRG